MRIPDARNLIIAKAISSAGSWIQLSAAGWWVLDQTGNATSVGVLAAVGLAPSVLGAPVGGVLAAKYDIRRLSALFNILQAIPVFVIAMFLWDNQMSIPLLYVMIFISAVPRALNTSMSSMGFRI